jgi:sulfide:quinone oxidoreductase
VVCAGGRFKPAIGGATTFPDDEDAFSADELLDRAEAKDHRVAFIVPGGVTWSLPLYELALMTQRRAAERGVDAKIAVITPESAPLAIFGPAASAAVGELLAARGIQLFTNSTVRDLGGAGITLNPGDRRIGPSESVALPGMEGPRIDGLPADEGGFIPVDDHGRVKGVEDVYAAGDGTNFPIKQGGLGTQQADAVAAHLAHRVGAGETPEPFRPVLRGKLLTGGESMSMRADVAGGGGEGVASLDYLWWPPHKISSRYLASLLHYGEVHAEPEPPGSSLDVEVALPNDWHTEPMALDVNEPPRVD